MIVIREAAEKNKEQIENAFKELLSNPDNEFRNSVEKTTKSIRATYNRFHFMGSSFIKSIIPFFFILGRYLTPCPPDVGGVGGWGVRAINHLCHYL
jgi:hypothetical protein